MSVNIKKENQYAAGANNEVQIEIDDVYACPGHCPGCVLSSLERKAFHPSMDTSTLSLSIDRLIEYVPQLGGVEKINLTYGIGDHFLMDMDYLLWTYHRGADLIEQVGLKNQYNGVFYTASLIGRTSLLEKKLKTLSLAQKKRGVPAYIIAVIDPKHFYTKSFSETYKDNIALAGEYFNRIDISLNISEQAIEAISPDELFFFIKGMGFEEITINWVPTTDNIKYVYFDQNKLLDWLIRFDLLIKNDQKVYTSYRPVILKVMNNVMCKTIDGKNTLRSDLDAHIFETVSKSIHIDHLGNVFPKYEAIGDISHAPRMGFAPWGNVKDDSIMSLMLSALEKTKVNVLKELLTEPCIGCNYNSFCAVTGFHAYNRVLRQNADKDLVQSNIDKMGCPHAAKGLFDHYLVEIKERMDQ